MRELNIINDLIETNDYLSIEYFMNKYSVSKRTLQNDFSYLTNAGKANGFHLMQKRGRGYLLEVLDIEKLNNFISKLDKISNKPKVSIENIVAYIALHDNYIKTDELVDILETSKSLIKKSKNEIDFYISKYNLVMDRKAHYGIKINNPLIEHRKLLIELYLKDNEMVKKYIDNKIGDNFIYVKKTLINKLKRRNLDIYYVELNEIIAWLKVTIYIHLKINTPINLHENSELLNIIAQKFNIGIPEGDIKEFTQLIKTKTKSNEDYIKDLEELPSDICAFFIDVDKKNNTSFNSDDDFKQLLTMHIASLVNRGKFKVSYTNPIIDELSIKYPTLFNIAISLSQMLEDKYGIKITRDEIGFIATHFAVHMEKEFANKFKKYYKIAIVCSTGGGSAYLTKLKIASLFETSNIETFSILQIKELEEFNPDIVFSTIDFNINLKVPLIYIKELLDDYDILKIKQLVSLDKIHGASISETKDYYIKRFFDPNYFLIEKREDDYIKCISNMSKIVEKAGIGGEDYSKLLLKRESFSSTIYLNGVAIPHPIEMKANKDLVFVKIFKNPIIFNNKKVSIIFMIALKKDNLELHKQITQDLFEIMNDIQMIQRLIKVNSFKEFIALINKKV